MANSPKKHTKKRGTKKPASSPLPADDQSPLLEQLSPEQQQQLLLEAHVSVQSEFSGPIPSPEYLEHYEKILPGAADRILSIPETEQAIRREGQQIIKHAIDAHKHTTDGQIKNDSLLINCAFLLALSLIVLAGIATWQGNALIALPLGLAGSIMALLRLLKDWRQDKNKNKDD